MNKMHATARSLRLTQCLLGLLVIGVWILALRPFLLPEAAAGTRLETFDEITVKRINIVDSDGLPRLVISNDDRLPAPVIRGKQYPRSIDAAGILFFQEDGIETGGLALATGPDGDNSAMMILDYTHQPTDGLSIFKSESDDGEQYTAGIAISDRLPYKPGEVETTQGARRIWLVNSNGNAQLVIADSDGKPRIRLGVDEGGSAAFEMLDAGGNVIHRVPRENN